MIDMKRAEMVNEINRVKDALSNTTSRKLKHDYGRYLKRLQRELQHYDRSMEKWQMNKI